MNVFYTGTFKKHFKLRIKPNKNLHQKFLERVELFIASPENPVLQDHQLKGVKRHLRAFSITGDIRVVYYIQDNVVHFIDIGTHNQVY